MEVNVEHQTYGYVRVSSRDQNEDRQVRAMLSSGVSPTQIFVDKQSGRDFDRPEDLRLLGKLREGDLLLVQSIDRLGRNYRDVIEQWRLLTQEKKVDIVVLDMEMLDTRRGKDLMGTFISDLVLQILSFVAESERAMIKQRQMEGIAAAKARGVKFGRPLKQLPHGFEEAWKRWQCGEISGTGAARECGMPISSFFARAKRRQAGLG